jgi:hypothetical protein
MLIPLSVMPLAEQIAVNEAHIKYTERVYNIKNRFYNLRARKQNEDIRKAAKIVCYLDEGEFNEWWEHLMKRWWWQ